MIKNEKVKKAIQALENELPFSSREIEVIKEYITKLERENKGLKTSLHNRETDLAHYKGYLTK